jgi:dienelactone hydrolase
MRAAIAAIVFAAAAPVLAADVSYSVGDRAFEGYYAKARNAKGLVLIIHDWDGMTDYERRRADMLAELGYDAFALDLFGAGVRPDTVDGRRAETGKLYGDRETMRALIRGGLDAARAQGGAQTAVVMGYCFGGAATLESARNGLPDVVGYASFHGGVETPAGQGWPSDAPPVLILQGGADQSPSMADIAQLSTELEAAGVRYDIEVYSGAPHAFTVFGSDRYRERADSLSWEALQGFLGERFEG